MMYSPPYCNYKITVSEKQYVESTRMPKPLIKLEGSFDYFKLVFNYPWIVARVKKCIEDGALGTEIIEDQYCVFIDDCISSENGYVFNITDGRTKIAFNTSSNISNNLNFYYNEMFDWTGYIILIKSYKILLVDANIMIESDNYVLLEFDGDAYDIVNKRMKWLKKSEHIPYIADLMKEKLGVEVIIPDDQKKDWKDILTNGINFKMDVENNADSSDEEESVLFSLLKTIQKSKESLPVPESDASTSKQPNTAGILMSLNTSETLKSNTEDKLPRTSTPQVNTRPGQMESLNQDMSCILNTNITNLGDANNEKGTIQSKTTEITELVGVNDANKLNHNEVRHDSEIFTSQKRICCSNSSDDRRNTKYQRTDSYSSTEKSSQSQTAEKIVSSFNIDGGLRPTTVQELRDKLKRITDKNGKSYKISIISDSENESPDEELGKELKIKEANLGGNKTTDPLSEHMEICDNAFTIANEEIIENSQVEIASKVQSSIQRVNNRKYISGKQANSTKKSWSLFPMVIHVDHRKSNNEKVQIGAAGSRSKIPRHILEKPWVTVSTTTIKVGKNTEEMLRNIRRVQKNPEEFKQAFLKHLNIARGDKKP